MAESNTHTPTDNQNEQTLNFLRNEIDSLRFTLKKKEERIASLDVMLNMVMEGHHAEIRAYENLEDKLKDVIEKLRERVPHSDILEFLRVKDRNGFW